MLIQKQESKAPMPSEQQCYREDYINHVDFLRISVPSKQHSLFVHITVLDNRKRVSNNGLTQRRAFRGAMLWERTKTICPIRRDTHLIWLIRCSFLVNVLLHTLQQCGLSPLCWRMWLLRCSLRVNVLLQYSHLCGESPVCSLCLMGVETDSRKRRKRHFPLEIVTD